MKGLKKMDVNRFGCDNSHQMSESSLQQQNHRKSFLFNFRDVELQPSTAAQVPG